MKNTKKKSLKEPKHWSHRFNIKPISANKLWYKNKQMTTDYRKFRENFYDDLPDRKRKWPFDLEAKLHIEISVGYGDKRSDVDNCIKGTVDTLQSIFGFNDKYVQSIYVEKEIVKRSDVYLEITVIEE